MMRGTATLGKAEEVLRKKYASSQMSDVQVALSGMYLASNELTSEILHKTVQKAHLSVPIMNKGLDMLVKVLFLQALPPEVRLKFSGYLGTTQQLMNEADSNVITLRQEKQHKLPVSVASNKQDLAVSEHGNPYEVGALSVLQALLSEEESSINRKLCSATNSSQAHSDNEEHGSRAEQRDGNERSRHQRWGYTQNDRHSSSRRHYDTHKQGLERGLRPRYDSHQTSGQHVRCYECQRTGHVARFCPDRSMQSNSQGNQWHTPQWKQCYEDQQRQLRQLQVQVAHQFEGPQGDVPNPRATLSSNATHASTRPRAWLYEGQPIGNVTAWSMDLCLVKLDAPLDKPVCLGADFENCTGPFYVVHCVNTGMKFLIDNGAAIVTHVVTPKGGKRCDLGSAVIF